MTRPADRTYGTILGGNLIAAHLTDPALDVGTSINGEEPLRQAGDSQFNLVRLRCAGCGQVGMVFGNIPAGRTQQQVMFTETQIVTDWETSPPSFVMIRNLLVSDGPVIQADCSAHGVVEFDSGEAVRLAWHAIEEQAPAVLHASPLGYRRPVRCSTPRCCTFPLDELETWLGWGAPKR